MWEMMTAKMLHFTQTYTGLSSCVQSLLSLRIGFASIAMKVKSAFLILDDAFQHYDWHRRRNLINHTLSLVKTGWQGFCFTMDDHIRDPFQEAGDEVGKGFKSRELC